MVPAGTIAPSKFSLAILRNRPDAPNEPHAQVNANLVQIKERVLRKVHKSFYFGLEVDYQRLSSVEFIARTQEPLEYPTGSGGSSDLGLGTGILVDNRHNILNVRKGFFSEDLQRLDRYREARSGSEGAANDLMAFKALSVRKAFNPGNPIL